MFFDPLYFIMILPGMALAMWASWKTKSTFNKYAKVRTVRGMTGAQAAQALLDQAGIRDVNVVPHRGFLTDHYNPLTKKLALSEAVYGSNSVSAVGVACHEAGHAIQHAEHYAPLKLRSALVPAVNFGNRAWIWMFMIGMLLAGQAQQPGGPGQMLMLGGVVLFGATVLFQLVTLPVEFDASARAKRLAFSQGLVLEQEQQGMAKVLNAAALTYVAAALQAILTLLYLLIRSGLLGGRRD